MTPKPDMNEGELVLALEKIIYHPRAEQAEIGRQAATMIRRLEVRLHDACSMVLSDKPMCVVCFETEPHTGYCGSKNPAALCNQPAEQALAAASKAEADKHLMSILHPHYPPGK